MYIWCQKWSKKLLPIWTMTLLVLLVFPQSTNAHMATVGYSDIYIDDHTINYQLYLDPSEVAQWVDSHSSRVFVIGGPENQSATGQEVKWTGDDLLPLIKAYLDVRNNGKTAEPQIKEISLKKRQGITSLFVNLYYEFPDRIDKYTINYNFFYDGLDSMHQNFATLHVGQAQSEIVLNKGNRLIENRMDTIESNPAAAEITIPAWFMTVFQYIRLGIEHIWTGYDHLLFIAALFLLKQRLTGYLKILTAFTFGHSITLALAALDIVSLSPRIVEPLIALSIVYVAVENIWIKRLRWRWAVALCFGLIHGFGFAQVLKGSFGERYILSLFSFNAGVELGQIAVLAVLLPLLVFASRITWYRSAAYAVSGLIAVIGLFWFIERTI